MATAKHAPAAASSGGVAGPAQRVGVVGRRLPGADSRCGRYPGVASGDQCLCRGTPRRIGRAGLRGRGRGGLHRIPACVGRRQSLADPGRRRLSGGRRAERARLAHGDDPALRALWQRPHDDALARFRIAPGRGLNIAIPLCPSLSKPAVVLTLYSPYAGGFHSEDQQAFVEQIKTVLDLALARLAPPRQGAELLPFFVRERWRAMIATAALQMHYQPLIRLADGRITELEALARLRDESGELLAPARFLPALSADDLIVLFRQGLTLAAACRESLRQAGHTLDMSVNAPAAALEDPRYAEVAAAV